MKTKKSFFTLGKIRNIGNIAISLFLVLVLMALPIAAQSQETAQSLEYTQGKTDGEHDAKGNTGYILGGFLCGLLAVLYCYLQESAPPASALAGKSPQYVMGYLEAYKKTKRSRDASFAWAGYAIGCILNLVLFATGAYKIE